MNRTATHSVTLIPGDGIGPECVRAAQRIVETTGAKIDSTREKIYATGSKIDAIASRQRSAVASQESPSPP